MRKFLPLVFSTITMITPATWAGEKWKVTSLEWPPFTCEKCPEQGAGTKALKEALASVGIELEVVFLPWSRAIKEGADKSAVGYYPSWPEDVTGDFSGSPSVFKSPVGFIEPSGKPLNWSSLQDLKGKTVGVVQDYGNTKDFNAAAKAGVFKTEVVPSDDVNVKKVAAGRIDAAIIDINNAKWYLQTDLKDLAGKVTINGKILEEKDLLIALNTHSKDKAAKLKEALGKVNTQKIVEEYLKKYVK